MGSLALGLSSLVQSADSKARDVDADLNAQGGIQNPKKLQQDLRISKKAEQVAKEKLTQTKKKLEQVEKEFMKYKEDSEQRIDQYKSDIGILQKHYDQLQNSINESELDKSQTAKNDEGNRTQEMIRIIDDHNKQLEARSKELEQVSHKLQRKKDKLSELKKNNQESDAKAIKLRSALDNVKIFFKVLSTNYIKIMKQSNQNLKEQIIKDQAIRNEELEQFKLTIVKQVQKGLVKREQEFRQLMKIETDRYSLLESKNKELESIISSKDQKHSEEFEQKLKAQKDKSQKKMAELKQQIQQLQQHQQSEGDSKSAITEQLKEKVVDQKRQIEKLELQINSEKGMAQIQINELNKDLQQKLQIISELREREQSIQKKAEEVEERHRVELKKLIDKQDSERIQYLQKEAEISSAREAEKFREFKGIFEGKVREKEEENSRLREQIQRIEANMTQGKEGLQIKLEQQIQELRTFERDNHLLQTEKTDITKKLQKKETKISSIKQSLQVKDQECKELSTKLIALQNQNELLTQKVKTSELELKQKDDKLKQSEENMRKLEERLEYLENQLDQTKFDLNDEIRVKDETINDLKIQKSLMKEERDQYVVKESLALDQNRILLEQIELLKTQVQEQIDKLAALESQKLEIQQQSARKKKKVLKRKKVDKDIQTVTNSVSEENLVQVQLQELEVSISLMTFSIINKTAKDGQLSVQMNEPRDVKLSPKGLSEGEDSRPRSPPIQGSHIGKHNEQFVQEEDEFELIKHMESIERRQEPREQPKMDMAMRAPGFRPPVQRPTGPPGMRGRGGPQFRPAGMPGQFRPPVQAQQPMAEDRQTEIPQQVPNQQEREARSLEQLDNQQPNIVPQFQEQPKQEQPPQFRPQQIRESSPIQNQPSAQVNQLDNSPKSAAPIPQASPKKEEPKQMTSPKQVKQQNEEEKKGPVTGDQQQQALLDLRNNRFFGMINGFITFLTRRRQAYTGKPASAMKWDPVKKRYIFDGQDESDDDIPPPPPPVTKKKDDVNPAGQQTTSGQGKNEKSEDKKLTTDASDLTKPAMPSFMANRGRGRGGRGAMMGNRFPQTFAPNQLSEGEKIAQSIEERKQEQAMEVRQEQQVTNEDQQNEVSQLYTTTLDITQVNQSVVHEHPTQRVEEQHQVDQSMYESVRESQWLDKFSTQNDKIKSLKYKNSALQQQLKQQREENEQTIENFTILCQDLKFKGIEEVEDLQQDIQILKDQLRDQACSRAVIEIKYAQMQDQVQYYEKDIEEMRETIRKQKFELIQMQIEKMQTPIEPEDSSSFEDEKKIMDLEMENERLRWQIVTQDTERLQRVLDLKDAEKLANRLRIQLTQQEREHQRAQDYHRRQISEVQSQMHEQIQKVEREKDNVKEILQRVQNEKDRMQDQQRERMNEYEQRVKKAEADRSTMQEETSRILREKDIQTEQIKSQLSAMNQKIEGLKAQIQQKTQEAQLSNLEKQQLQQKVQSLVQKSKLDQEHTEQMLKAQINQIQDILQEKSQLLEQYESKQEEQNQELQSMKHLKHKLTENIVYLQNEIRKRDDLLESSEFGDLDIINADEQSESSMAMESDSVRNMPDDDIRSTSKLAHQRKKKKTFASQLQQQLDETRSQLKQNIEEKLKTQRKYQMVYRNFQSLIERVQDISTIMDQHQQNCGIEAGQNNMNNEQASSMFQEEETKSALGEQVNISGDSLLTNHQSEEMINSVIAKIFSVTRHYEQEISEAKHNYHMAKMQSEEAESLKFDIEILNDEKQMLDSELAQQKLFIQEQETKAQEQRSQLKQQQQIIDELRQKAREQQEHHDRQIQNMTSQFETEKEQLNQETERRIEEIHETFKSKVLPEIKQKHQTKYSKLKEQIEQVRQSMSMQLEEQQRINQTLEMESRSMMNQTQVQIEHENEEKDRLQERLNFIEIEKQELLNNLSTLKAEYDIKINELTEMIQQKTTESEEQSASFDQYRVKMEQDFKDAVSMLKSRHEEKMKKFKADIQTKIMAQMEAVNKEHEETLQQLKQQHEEELNNALRSNEQAQQEISKMRATIEKQGSELNQLKNEKNTITQKEAQLKSQVEEMRNKSKQTSPDHHQDGGNKDLQNQIEKLETDLSQAHESYQRRQAEIQMTIQTLTQEKQELSERISKHEEEIATLLDQLLQEQQEHQRDLKQQQDFNSEIKAQFRQDYEQLQIRLETLQNLQKQKPSDQIEDDSRENELQMQVTQLTAQIVSLKQEFNDKVGAAEGVKSELASRIEDLSQQNTQLQKSLDEVQIQLNELRAKSEQDAKVQKDEYQIRLKSLQEELQRRQERIDNLDEELIRTQSKCQKLEYEFNVERQEQKDTVTETQRTEASDSYQQIEIRQKLEEEYKAEMEKKIGTKEQEFNQEREALIQHYTSREEEFKNYAEKVATKFKDAQSKSKHFKSENEKLIKEKTELLAKIVELNAKLDAGEKDQQAATESRISALEQQVNELQEQISSKDSELEGLKTSLEKVQNENKELESKIKTMQNEVKFVLVQLEIEGTDLQWDAALEKLRDEVQNYQEDKRSLKQMINERESILQERDNYMSQRDQLSVEKSKIEEKFDSSLQNRLEKRVKQLEEERSEMKSDFYIKINSFTSEISTLRDKLQRYEPVDEEEDNDSIHQANQTLVEEMKQQPRVREHVPSFMDESKTSVIDPSRQERTEQGQNPAQQRSGLFNSIASFFLTDSELQH